MTPRVLIVSATYYPHIASELENGARDALLIADSRNCAVETITVPGVFELPGAIAMAADSNQYDGYVALGCVIRGETSHYDHVCSESAHGLMHLAITRRLAIGYGILTVENEKQAMTRASCGQKNKGRDAALACLAMLELRDKFRPAS